MKRDKRDDIKKLREKFISQFCKMKKWNINKLTTQQMLEIAEKFEYKLPK